MCDVDPCWQFRSILVTEEHYGACGIVLPFRAGVQTGTVTSSYSLGRRNAIPHWLWEKQIDWEQAANHYAVLHS